MVWHPFHFQDGELLPTAFEKPDLLAFPDREGRPRYMSVDDLHMISQASVDWRIAWQQRDGTDPRRENARFVRFQAGTLRQCECPDGSPLCRLTREPTLAGEAGPESPENPAHCGVHTVAPERFQGLTRGAEKVALLYMRTQLVKSIEQIFDYGEVFPDAA